MDDMIARPLRAVVADFPDAHGETVYLEFPKDVPTPDGEYWMRGAVIWPAATPVEGQPVAGIGLLAGMHVKSGKIYVFETFRFLTVEHVRAKNGSIEFEGVITFFKNCWHYYYADLFYWNQQPHVHERNMAKVYNCSQIAPTPRFVELGMPVIQDTLGAVWERAATDRLMWNVEDKHGSLDSEMRLYHSQPSAALPMVAALGTCISGMEKWPYRKPLDEDAEI